MLHQINQAQGIQRLMRVVEFQRKVLAYACDAATPLAPTEADIRNAFAAEGGWLWERLAGDHNRRGRHGDNRLMKALKRLIRYCHKHPTLGPRIVDAFDHDVEFFRHINDGTFQFRYTRLSKATRKEVRPLMEAFYNELFESGFPACVHGEAESFSRTHFVEAFKAANASLRVCPACDGPPAESERRRDGGEKTYADTDHFLPKSKYPFLAVHPANLVPVCIHCNRTFKGSGDPIDDLFDEPLRHIFHPYLKPAIADIQVRVVAERNNRMAVCIEDKLAHPSRRVKSLNRVFRLETRWPTRLEGVKESIIEAILNTRNIVQRHGGDTSPAVLRSLLEETLKSRQQRVGRHPSYILHASYLEYAMNAAEEFDDLLVSFKMP